MSDLYKILVLFTFLNVSYFILFSKIYVRLEFELKTKLDSEPKKKKSYN